MEWLLFILILATAYQCYFLWRVFPLAFVTDQEWEPGEPLPPVSVIVCFRNEAFGLTKYQSWIAEQDYPNYELVAVDDHSTDGSTAIIAALAAKHPKVRLVTPPYPTRPGKKDALTFGIQQAQHDILLLIDADCVPESPDWIRRMTAPLAANPNLEVVLGVSPYDNSNNVGNHSNSATSLVNLFQQFETLYTAFQYLGLARLGRPYMGVGRNLAYRKSFFQRAGGLEQHAHLAGGDDDLLLSHNAQPERTTTVTHPNARTISAPAKSWSDYWQRKRRHVGVGVHYPLGPKLLIGGLALSHVLHYGLVILLLCLAAFSPIVWGLLALRWILVIWVYGQRNGEMMPYGWKSFPTLLLLDASLCFYYANTVAALFRPGAGEFKGRSTNFRP